MKAWRGGIILIPEISLPVRHGRSEPASLKPTAVPVGVNCSLISLFLGERQLTPGHIRILFWGFSWKLLSYFNFMTLICKLRLMLNLFWGPGVQRKFILGIHFAASLSPPPTPTHPHPASSYRQSHSLRIYRLAYFFHQTPSVCSHSWDMLLLNIYSSCKPPKSPSLVNALLHVAQWQRKGKRGIFFFFNCAVLGC